MQTLSLLCLYGVVSFSDRPHFAFLYSVPPFNANTLTVVPIRRCFLFRPTPFCVSLLCPTFQCKHSHCCAYTALFPFQTDPILRFFTLSHLSMQTLSLLCLYGVVSFSDRPHFAFLYSVPPFNA